MSSQAAVPRPHQRPDGIPTRADRTHWTPAELAIADAIAAVEEMGASEFLTQAVVLLGRAQGYVADHAEGLDAVHADLEAREQAMFAAIQKGGADTRGQASQAERDAPLGVSAAILHLQAAYHTPSPVGVRGRKVLPSSMLTNAQGAIMAAVRECDEKPDESTQCACSRFIRSQIEFYAQFAAGRALDELTELLEAAPPAPPPRAGG